jgi:ferredoxin/coenzyme F420-reducing hydrogenase delta subunit
MALEAAFDRAFGPAQNPLAHLGALGFFFYWIVVATGVHLYIGFDTAVAGAYQSVEHLSRSAWFLGGVSRSLHRYASDALVLVMFVHMLREFAFDRYRGVRWFSWIVGVPIIAFVYASGITGYWLVWDRLAQYVAIASTEWLDWLPIFGEPIARNFLTRGSLDDRFFTLLVFLHIAVPLILVFVLWIHLQRISRPNINPPKHLAAGTAAMLLALSLVYPATSQGPADLGTVTSIVRPDWFYLPLYPLVDFLSAGTVWAIVAAGTLAMIAIPWLPPLRRPPAAVVTLDLCNGCGRCAEDCPYAAISMAPRSDGKPFETEAVVDPDHCVACGICVGACPTSTPFRSDPLLPTAIDLPDPALHTLRAATRAASARLTDRPRVLVFGCLHGAAALQPERADTAAVPLPCVGMLPPSFIDYVLSRDLAEGVFLAGCADSSCYNRLGTRWTKERLAGERDPRLRARVPRERVATAWAALQDRARLAAEIAAFRARLPARAPDALASAEQITESEPAG